MPFPISHGFFPPQTVTGQKLFCVLFWVGIYFFFLKKQFICWLKKILLIKKNLLIALIKKIHYDSVKRAN